MILVPYKDRWGEEAENWQGKKELRAETSKRTSLKFRLHNPSCMFGSDEFL